MATRPLPLNRLLERLDSEWHLTRKAAIRQAEALDGDALERLLHMAAAQGRRKRRRGAFRVACLLGGALLVFAILRANHLPPASAAAVSGCFAFFGWLLILLPLAVMGQEQQAYPAVLDICADTGDPRFLGAALTRFRLLRIISPEESGEARKARMDRVQAVIADLTAMFHVVDADNAPLLTREQHTLLLFLLDPKRTSLAFTTAALHALPFIGQESALAVLSNLRLDLSLPAPVWEAARICHTHLEARLALSRQAGSLLRPSSSNDLARNSSLLRPASAQPADTAPEQLLRPTSGVDR